MKFFKTEDKVNKSVHKHQLSYYVSNTDILKKFKNCKIITYANLDLYKNIYDLLPNDVDFCIILTEWLPNSGHWCLLIRFHKYFEWFDPYGDKPSSLIPPNKGIDDYLGNCWKKDLGKILKSVKREHTLKINKFKFQEKIVGINTCGRWCLTRLEFFLNDGYDLNDFKEHMVKLQKEYLKPLDVVILTF